MAKKSAGILLYRLRDDELEVFLVHPGGPYWSNKDDGAWSIPKGEIEENENPVEAALREVEEEIGLKARGEMIELTPVKQKSGKVIFAWAMAGDYDIDAIQSNMFEMEWPPKSSIFKTFPEIDKGSWFEIKKAKIKIHNGQLPLLEELQNFINNSKR